MKWQHILANFYQNMFLELEKVLDGVSVEDLQKQPAPGANTIGWLCWHTIRSCDRFLGDVALGEQLWASTGWHKKFNRSADYKDTGTGYTDAQVDALRIPSGQLLLEYERAVASSLVKYLEGLTEKELEREARIPRSPALQDPYISV